MTRRAEQGDTSFQALHEHTTIMAATEILRIKNFAGIQEAEIELSRMNVFIGPQASGKSVCAKLLFFFKSAEKRFVSAAVDRQTNQQIREENRNRFLKFFPPSNWGRGTFQIEYVEGSFWIKVERIGDESSSIKVTYSRNYTISLRKVRKIADKTPKLQNMATQYTSALNASWRTIDTAAMTAAVTEAINAVLKTYRAGLEGNYFIPAGRSFFSTLRGNVFSFIADDVGIDPFLAEFGRLYERFRRYNPPETHQNSPRQKEIASHVTRLLCGTHKRVGQRDYIVSDDGRQVALENSSSGQQEILPLALTLLTLSAEENLTVGTLFVEEPEAHLYPTAQREIVHLLSSVTDLSSKEASSQYVITTHSPYILSALNNLMYGAQIVQQSPANRQRVTQILGDAALVDPNNVRAYAFGNGRIQSVISPDTGLVKATILDSVSNELAKEFGALVDIMFEEMAA